MTQEVEEIGGTIHRDGDFAVIRIPIDQAHRLRVSLQPCGCVAAKSNSGIAVRKALKDALGPVVLAKVSTPDA